MVGVTPPWANFIAGANDKIVNPPRTSYGTPKPTPKYEPPSTPGPRAGQMRRNPDGIPAPNMGILPPAPTRINDDQT